MTKVVIEISEEHAPNPIDPCCNNNNNNIIIITSLTVPHDAHKLVVEVVEWLTASYVSEHAISKFPWESMPPDPPSRASCAH